MGSRRASSRALWRLGIVLGATLAATVFAASLAVLALLAATAGGPALVELGLLLNGR